VFKPHFLPALALAAALPAAAQDVAPDIGAFARAEWIEVGELADGVTLSISKAKYLDGTVLTFALKTEHATGDDASSVDVIELDCAGQKFRSVSAAATKRNGEQVTNNQPGTFDSYPPESVIGQLAVPLCSRVTGPPATEGP